MQEDGRRERVALGAVGTGQGARKAAETKVVIYLSAALAFQASGLRIVDWMLYVYVQDVILFERLSMNTLCSIISVLT